MTAEMDISPTNKANVTGWSWGSAEMTESHLNVVGDDGSVVFSLPVGDVASATIRGKNDLVVEMQADDSRDKDDEYIIDMHFMIPDEVNLNEIKDAIMAKTGGATGGELGFCRIEEVPMAQPRGGHDVEFLPNAFRLRGKTFSYNIKYKNVSRIFLLPKPDGVHVGIVVGLEQPVRQGNTAYPYLVFHFDKDRDVDLEIKGIPAEVMESAKLHEKEQSKLYDVLARLFKALTEKSAVMPAVEDFKASTGVGCIRCSHRSSEGFLYFMRKGFLFVNKPVVYIKYEDVSAIEFSRTEAFGGTATKYFDLKVYKKNENTPIDFQQVEREEYQPIIDFLQTNNIRIRNLHAPAPSSEKAKKPQSDEGVGLFDAELPSDDDDDEDFEADSADSGSGSESGSGSGSGSGSDSDSGSGSDSENASESSESE